MKKALSFILAVVLLIGLMPMQAFATEVPYNQLSTEWPSVNTDLTHIICYGQSFSTGSDAPVYPDPAVDSVYVYGNITNSSSGTSLTPLATTGNQHPIISAGNVLAKLLDSAGVDTDIVLGSYGSGGKTIAQLMSAERQAEIKTEEGYTYDILSSGRYEIFQNSVAALAQYAQKNNQSISCPAIVYLQGETDQNTDAQLGYPENSSRAGYGAGGDKGKYKEYMSRLKEDMQREVMEQYGQTEKPLFVIYQVSGTYTRTQYSSINMAQIEFAQENEDVILVQTPYFTSHYTNSHHLTQNGYRWLGEYIGRSIYTALVEREKPWPMLPESIEVTSKNRVCITVSGVQNGMTIDTWTVENASNSKNLYGFYLQADGKNIVPSNVSVHGNCIELTLPSNLTSETVYVYYAGKNASGTGNIRDNCTALGFYEYLDDSNDTGTGNNQGVSHSSLDADGNSIVGQKYPLYNWLASFCYEIEVPEVAQRQPANYHWEIQETGLVSITDGNATENTLTLVQGSVTDGVLNKVQYTMEKEIVLEHDRPWVIEWKAAGNGNSYCGGKFLSTTNSDSYAQYLYLPADSRGMVAWGVGSDSANYGFQLGKQGIDTREEHTYRIENRISDDGVNAVYLIVDGVEIGAMTTGYRTSANSSGSAGSMIEEPKNWANGKDLFVNGIGDSGSFLLNNMKLSYLKIWEAGQHTHTYTPAVTAPTCTEQGYTTYTCECGDSYVGDYVEAEGEHDFTEWSIIKEAVYNADGEESRKCNKCSHVEFRSVSVSVVTSGNLGKGDIPTDKVIYTLYSDGTMVLEGTGALFGIDWRGDNQPFIDYRKLVKHLIIGEGITSTTSGSLVKLSNLETIQFPSTLTHLPQNALMSCFRPDITELTIPATVVHLGAYSIGHYTGDNSAYFTDVIIENPDIQITDHNAVFNGGAKLDQLTLYSYGANNKVSAYAEKYGIRYVDLNNYLEGENGDIHYELSNGILILEPLVENASVSSGNQPWASYAEGITKVIMCEGIVSIPQNAFADYPALTEVTLPSSLNRIGDGAFSVTQNNATSLTMTLPRHMSTLGNNIFKGRTNVVLTVYSGSLGADLAEPGVELITKKVFKLMLIGNSYSEDASNGSHTTGSQLLDILQSMLGEDAEITLALLSSGGKGMHWHATQAEQGNQAYSFKVITTANPTWKSMGSYTSADALSWTDWDVVSLQPYNINVSTGQESVPYPDSTDEKYYHIADSSAYMLDHVNRYAPYADIYFYMHWAQTSSTVLNAALSNYNKAAAFMPQVLGFEGTESGAKFTTIIPVGLSIQNARTTYLALLRYNTTAYADGNLNLTTDAQIGLQRDGGHVSFNIGRYIAALTFAETIIPEEIRAEGYVLPEIRITESVGKLPKEYSEIAQKAVHAAVESWQNGSLDVTSIDGYTQDPTVAATETLKNLSLTLSCGGADALTEQIRTAVLAALSVDFAVDAIVVNTDTNTASVTIRFGYTSATVGMEYGPSNHSYTPTVTAPTCTEQGYTTYTCACGDSYVEDYVDATGEHTWGNWTELVAPTCDAEGTDRRICKICGEEQYRDTRITGDPNKILVSDPLTVDYFSSKNIVLIGDSITAGVGTTKRYGEYLAEILGLNVTHKGSSGTGYCSGGAMVTNKNLTEANVRNADIVTIMLGVNDWNWAVKDGSWNGKPGYYDESQTYYQLGNFDSTDTSTLYGALHSWCQNILALQQLEGFEDKQFIVITPMITSWNISLGKKDWNQDKLNIHGHTFREYCTAIMEVCAYYDIPVFDANMFSGIYYKSATDNNVAETGGDGVHVNAEGHALLAQSLAEFLMEGYSYETRTVADGGHTYVAGVCEDCRLPEPGPVITRQPTDAEAVLGDRYCVTVQAEGEGLKYQWYFRKAGSDKWYKSSVRDNTYDDVMTKARHNREVKCVITDVWGNCVESAIATITATPTVALAITRQPENQTVVLGDMFNVTFDAVGDELKYQWYFRPVGTETWYTSAQRDNSYDDVMTKARHNRELYCVVTDAWGNKVETNPVVTIMANPRYELAITAQPEDASAKLGEPFCVTVEAQGDELKYQWYYRNAGSDRWYKSGVRDNTYDDIMTTARADREIYCVITDMWGNSVTTDTATLIAVPSVELTILGVSYEGAAMGERYCATVQAEGEGLKYQWYFRNAGSDKWYKSSVRDNTYDDVMTKARRNRDVYCVITDQWGNRVVTDIVTLYAE